MWVSRESIVESEAARVGLSNRIWIRGTRTSKTSSMGEMVKETVPDVVERWWTTLKRIWRWSQGGASKFERWGEYTRSSRNLANENNLGMVRSLAEEQDRQQRTMNHPKSRQQVSVAHRPHTTRLPG